MPKADYDCAHFSDLTPQWLKERGINAVFLDLDNTIAAYSERECSSEVSEWLKELEDAGIAAAVISNGSKDRVEAYCGELRHIYRAGKPKPDTLLEMARRLSVAPKNVLMVGDQLRTDIRAGARAGMKTAWVRPLKPNLFHTLRYKIERLL